MLNSCRICGGANLKKKFSAEILKKYSVDYFLCENCGCLQTETPYWLDEAYKDPIAVADTGALARNIQFSKIASVLIYFFLNPNGKFLDYAGGYGIFTRQMRDIGFDFYWHDPYSMNLLARGFELKGGDQKFELVTAFEAFEHFSAPIKELEKLLNCSDNVLFSTQILPEPIPAPDQWWYYAPSTGQHINFYSMRTLEYLAQKNGMNLISNGSGLHLFTKNKKVNQRKFDFANRFCGRGLFFYVRKKMKSFTFDDMNMIIS